MKCRNCDGTGNEEVFIGCSRPAWDCCGGCVRDYSCFVCDGSGELTAPLNDWYTVRLFEVHAKLLKHEPKHTKWIESIECDINEFFYQKELYKI